MLAVCVVAVVAGTWRGRRQSSGWSPWRAATFATGVLTAVVAIDAWPGVYAGSLMSVLVSQQLVLLLVSPALIAFGRPQVPLHGLFPQASVPRALARAGRLASHVLVGPILVVAVLMVAVFSPLLQDERVHAPVGYAVHLGLLAAGFVIAVPLARDGSRETSLALGLALVVGLAELLLDAVPGIALRLDAHVLPGVATLATHRSWGPSALSDQRLAGGILWSVAEILDIPFLLILVRQWFRADSREALVIDAELDAVQVRSSRARRVGVEPADGSVGGTVAGPVVGERERPWWETDGEVFGEMRKRQFRSDVADPDGTPGQVGRGSGTTPE